MTKPRKLKITDWTCDSTGRANSSKEFVELCKHVERIIRISAFALIAGRADQAARLVMAQLAHVNGLAPRKRRPDAKP